jgi:leucyl aminopeptidase
MMMGKRSSDQLETLRNSSKILSVVRENDHEELLACDLVNDPELISAFVEGLVLSNYRFDKYLSKPDKKRDFPQLSRCYCPYLQEEDLDNLQSICEGVWLARDLVNEPLSHLNAVGLADRIREIGQQKGFSVEVMLTSKN